MAFDVLPALRGAGFLLSSGTSLHLSIQVGSCIDARNQQAGLTPAQTGILSRRRACGDFGNQVSGSIDVSIMDRSTLGTLPAADT